MLVQISFLFVALVVDYSYGRNCIYEPTKITCRNKGCLAEIRKLYDDKIRVLNLTKCEPFLANPLWIKQFPNLNELHLGSRLMCDCILYGKLARLNPSGKIITGWCASPAEMAGLPIERFKPCERKTKRQTREDRVFKVFPPKSMVAKSGDQILIPCVAPNHRTIDWLKDEVVIEPNWRMYPTPEGLIINPVRSEDSSSFSCRYTAGDRFVSSTVSVIVEAPANVHFEHQTLFPIEGSDFSIECKSDGFPRPSFRWTKNDQPYRADPLHPHILTFLNASRTEHNGLYTCTGRNIFGEDKASCQVSVREAVAPFISNVQKDTVARVGQGFVLDCGSTGYPSPQVRWFQNSRMIEFDGRRSVLSDGSLKVKSAEASDSGRYMCLAANSVGQARNSFWLRVIDSGDITVEGLVDLRIRAIGTRDNVSLTAYEDLAVEMLENRVDAIARYLVSRIQSPLSVEMSERLYEQGIRIWRRKSEDFVRILGFGSPDSSNLRPRNISSQQLVRLTAVTGCFPHQLVPRNCSSKCQKYRSADGTCNNLEQVMWGASQTPFLRWLPSEYDDDFSTPKGWNSSRLHNNHELPSPRLISSKLISNPKLTPDPAFTHMLMQWGQFVDHDFTHTLMATGTHTFSDARLCVSSCTREPPCYPIKIPKDDPRVGQRGNCIEFIKSTDVCLTGETSLLNGVPVKREQINQITSFIDASNVYGSTEQEQHDLREHSYGRGLLRMRKDPRYKQRQLPFAVDTPVDCQRDRDARASPVGCFLAGDHRASEQLGLTSIHTIWARQHNRLATQLGLLNPEWSSEQVFQETRKIVGAQMQHITYSHWLPLILGRKSPLKPYKGVYNNKINPGSVNVIATAAFRFGHTLINSIIYRLNASLEPIQFGNLMLRDAFFSPWRLLEEGGPDPILRGMFAVPGKLKRSGEILNPELTEHLFHIIREISQDLAALNIQRGRDHGLPSYTKYREFCGFGRTKQFEDLKHVISNGEIRNRLKNIYGHVDNIDVWAGGVLEDNVQGARVGPLFQCLIKRQFEAIRDGDRFWYENNGVFTDSQLAEIKKTLLSKVICENSDGIMNLPRNLFIHSKYPDDYERCEDLPDLDLSAWKGCCEENVSGQNEVCNTPSIYSYNPQPSIPSPYGN